MKKNALTLELSARMLYVLITLVLLLNLFFITGTWWFHAVYLSAPLHSSFRLLDFGVRQLDLSQENVIAAWYSSMLLCTVGMGALVCFLVDMQRLQTRLSNCISYGWLLFSAVFVLLSLDELGSFHETIGDTAIFNMISNDAGWELFGYLVGLIGLGMIGFSLLRMKGAPWAMVLLVVGVLLFLSIPIQEEFEICTMRASADPALWKRPIAFLLMEEGAEIMGSLCFLISTIIYSQWASRQYTKKNKGLLTVVAPINLHYKSAMLIFFLYTASLGIAIALIHLFPENNVNADSGIARNWFPSVTAFLSAVLCFALYKQSNLTNARFRIEYGSLATCCLATSVYFGINLYAFNNILSKVFSVGIILISVLIGLKIMRVIKNKVSRYTIVGWAILCVFAFGRIGAAYTPEISFVASSLLVVALASHLYNGQSKPVLKEKQLA